MKIKSDKIVNSFSSCRNLSLVFAPIPSAKGAAREIPRRPWPISFRCSGEDQRYLEQIAIQINIKRAMLQNGQVLCNGKP